MPAKKAATTKKKPGVCVSRGYANAYNPNTCVWEQIKTGDTFPVDHPLVTAHPDLFEPVQAVTDDTDD